MPSKLPDVRCEIASPYTELDPGQVQALAKSYKFYKAYDLYGALTGTIDYSYLLLATSQEPPRDKAPEADRDEVEKSSKCSLEAVPAATTKTRLSHKEHKAYLTEIEKRAKSLHEALTYMNTQLYYELHHGWPRPTTKKGWRLRLEGDVQSLARAAKRALNKMPQSKGGRPEDPFYSTLTDRLIDIYQEGTGDRTRYWHYEAYKDEYAGECRKAYYDTPLVRFIRDVFALLGLDRTNITVGKALERAFKKRPKANHNR